MTDLHTYARRIDFSGPLMPTLAVLDELCWRHQMAIPFENLDIFLLNRPISLEPEAIFHKLVDQRRGGFCFEQNGLLAMVLEQIGFGVSMGYATWQMESGEWIVPFDHQVLRVEIPGEEHPWLADVGFGRDTPAGPLPLVDGGERSTRTGHVYRITRREHPELQWSVAQRTPGEVWRQLYDVDLRPRRIEEFEGRSQFNQHSPESHFTQGIICSRPVEGGRVTVSSSELIVTRDGERVTTPLEGMADVLQALDAWFGIRIEERWLRLLAERGGEQA